MRIVQWIRYAHVFNEKNEYFFFSFPLWFNFHEKSKDLSAFQLITWWHELFSSKIGSILSIVQSTKMIINLYVLLIDNYFFSALNFSFHSFSYVFFTICMILFHWNSNILIQKTNECSGFFKCECKANGDLLANEFQIKSQENTKIKNNKEKEMIEKRKCWIHERVFNGSKWTPFS